MKPNQRAIRTALAFLAAALAVVAGACGSAASGNAVEGAVVADAPVAAAITLKDSSTPPRLATATADASGRFRVDVTGLTPPFVLRARTSDGSGRVLHTVASGGGTADVNPLTETATAGASRHGDGDREFEDDDAEEHHRTESRFLAVLTQLRTVLAPLFDLYGIGSDPLADRQKLRALLADVRFAVRDGAVTVTNRATGGVIFTGPLSDLASGTFHPENLPGGSGGPPPPPDGAALYSASCQSCHGPLATSQVRGATAAAIQAAISANTGGMGSTALRALTSEQIAAIASALAGSPPPPPACTYTYSAWSACSNGTQTRTVLTATPPGCTGTPVLSQACTAIDGAALYATYCAGCHGNGKKGSSAAAIQNAIDANVGGMGSTALRALTPEQIAAIAAAP